MFDVDCPQTPDRGEHKKTLSRPSSDSRRLHTSSITTPNGARSTISGSNRNHYAPRACRRSYDTDRRAEIRGRYSHCISGLDPEGKGPPINQAQSFDGSFSSSLPSSGPRSRLYHAAPNSAPSIGHGGNVSNNPFDDLSEQENRRRTHSDSWWKEEIVDENDDKNDVLDGYYGLSCKEKQQFFSPSKNPFEDSMNQYGHTSFRIHKAGPLVVGIGINKDGSIESSLLDIEKQYQGAVAGNDSDQKYVAQSETGERFDLHDNRQVAKAVMKRPTNQEKENNFINNSETMKSSIFEHASSMRDSGHYHVDDYSFSTININNIPNDRQVVSYDSKKAQDNTFARMPKWFEGFAPGKLDGKFYETKEHRSRHHPFKLATEISNEPQLQGNSHDWLVNSPKVAFDTDYRYSGDLKYFRNGLKSFHKICAGVVMVVVMCTLLAISISSLNKSNKEIAIDGDRSNSVQAFFPENNTSATVHTLNPSQTPTMPPMRVEPQKSKSPISGYSSIHEKYADRTDRPSRSPITQIPTLTPISFPQSISIENESSSTLPVVSDYMQDFPDNCTDDEGYFLNHLFLPKDCLWLFNGKDGFTDRKDKNCGSTIYKRTELGTACRATCALYNGCVTSDFAVLSSPSSQSSSTDSQRTSTTENSPIDIGPITTEGENVCHDDNGSFKNHLGSVKTCSWLYNGKPGQTDRKDKNCGYGEFPITELGQHCPETCIWYNQRGCSIKQTRSNSFIHPAISSMSSPLVRPASSTACVNGSGEYLSHAGTRKQCQWLHIEDDSEASKLRQDLNCGVNDHTVTELGRECPWSCKKYNGCGMI